VGRRFPPPWTAEETDPYFNVKHHNGQARHTSISRTSPAGARPRTCSRAMRQGALRRMLRSCRTCYGGDEINDGARRPKVKPKSPRKRVKLAIGRPIPQLHPP
jgi:hypothetical protein